MSRIRPGRAAVAIAAFTAMVVTPTTADVGASANADFTAVPIAPTDRVTADKALTSRVAETDPALLGRTDATPVQVMIKLDYDSTATYTGTVEGLDATSPSVTGQDLTGESTAEVEYEGYIAEQEAAFEADLASVAGATVVGEPLRTVYGGVRAIVPANQVGEVAALDGVVAVQ